MNVYKYTKEELLSIFKHWLKFPSSLKGQDASDVIKALGRYGINVSKIKKEIINDMKKESSKKEIKEVKWIKPIESIPVGTKVKITYGTHKGKIGVVSDDAPTDKYSIVKVSGKKITIDDSDLLIRESNDRLIIKYDYNPKTLMNILQKLNSIGLGDNQVTASGATVKGTKTISVDRVNVPLKTVQNSLKGINGIVNIQSEGTNMKKSELQKLIKEQVKTIVENKKEETELLGLITTVLSDVINQNFNKNLKKGMVANELKVKVSDSGSRRMKVNTLEFWLEPADLKRRAIPVTLTVQVAMRD